MSAYLFEPQKERPDRINVYDPSGVLVMWLPADAALVIAMMYQTTTKHRGLRQGNELMYGYLLGITHAMLYADQFPKVEVIRNGPNMSIKVIDADGTVMQPITPIEAVPGHDHFRDQALRRGGLMPGEGETEQ